MPNPSKRTFLVESYVPALDRATAAALTARLRAAVLELRGEGRQVTWLRSFALLEDETYLWLIAGEADDVVVVNERARLSCDHFAEVVADEPLSKSEASCVPVDPRE